MQREVSAKWFNLAGCLNANELPFGRRRRAGEEVEFAVKIAAWVSPHCPALR
jgi:hypothetical protein